jgi:hypothetical protein
LYLFPEDQIIFSGDFEESVDAKKGYINGIFINSSLIIFLTVIVLFFAECRSEA